MTTNSFAGSSITALGLAASRAVESSRPDRLIDDPFALPLFEAAQAELPMRTSWPADYADLSDSERLHLHGSRYIGLRTRFYDDALLAAASDGLRQAVLLGAGLDTRALRLGLPLDFTVFELDQTAVLAFKKQVLDMGEPRWQRTVHLIGQDLSQPWGDALAAAGFSPDQPSIWLAEGLLPYLDGEAQLRLLTSVDEMSAPGSRAVFDHLLGGDVAQLTQRSGLRMDEMLLSVKDQQTPIAHLIRGGWTVSTLSVEEISAAYRRDLSDPFSEQESSLSSAPWLQTEFVRATAPDANEATTSTTSG